MLILSLISIQCWEFNTKVAIQGIGTIADKILCNPHTVEKKPKPFLLYDKYIESWIGYSKHWALGIYLDAKLFMSQKKDTNIFEYPDL